MYFLLVVKMAMVEPHIAHQLMERIKKIEQGTDLKRVAIISKAGMKIASATSDVMDADAETGSSAALIELASKLSESVNHKGLREIIVKAKRGFVILQHINKDFMIFGGISNPLRVGYYLEYLRNEANRFAYLIAGGKVTEELKQEIEWQKERAKKLERKGVEKLTEGFEMDVSAEKDLEAIQGVLQFLKEWSEDEVPGSAAESAPTGGNVVGLEQDLLFGFDDMGSLAPTSISEEDIKKARSISQQQEMEAGAESSSAVQTETGAAAQAQSVSEEDAMAEVLSALDAFTSYGAGTSSSETGASTAGSEVIEEEEGLPDDILATLDELTDGTALADESSAKADQAEDLPYGIKIYEGEVPPVPLDDYVSFEVGTLTKHKETAAQDYSAQTPETEGAGGMMPAESEQTSLQSSDFGMADEFGGEIPLDENGEPDFDSLIASEYVDPDLGLEEDELVEALKELEKEDKEKNL